jgi:glutathione S-transferase
VDRVEAPPVLVGRSSSHFTRAARMFASELGVRHEFEIVRDLLAQGARDWGQNPALRVPVLRTDAGGWFGSLNICREFWRRSDRSRIIVWPEQFETPLLANAQELTLQAMATGVELLMAGAAAPKSSDTPPNAHVAKRRASLEGTLRWLDSHVEEVLTELPAERDVSFLEVSLFCLTTHLDFRGLMSTEPFGALRQFCERMSERPSARSTPYLFDK